MFEPHVQHPALYWNGIAHNQNSEEKSLIN